MNKSWLLGSACALGICVFTITVARADLIFLKNGREIEGKIIKEDEEKLWVLTTAGGKIGIEKGKLLKIEAKAFNPEAIDAQKGAAGTEDKKPSSQKKSRDIHQKLDATVTYGQPTQDPMGTTYVIGGKTYQTVKMRDDKPTGTYREFYDDGEVRMEVEMINGLKEGLAIAYYGDGKIMEEGVYEASLKVGAHKSYWENGRQKSQVEYLDGKREGLARYYYDTGELEREIPYAADTPNGEEKMYYKSGKPLASQSYQQGKAKGVGKKFYESGAMQEASFFDMGLIKTYFENGGLKSKLVTATGEYVEYDNEGAVVFEGILPPVEETEAPDELTQPSSQPSDAAANP